jgi:hypothetical protein
MIGPTAGTRCSKSSHSRHAGLSRHHRAEIAVRDPKLALKKGDVALETLLHGLLAAAKDLPEAIPLGV